jgi:hypothetical protein
MCEYERREPDRHDGHVVQVSASTYNIRSEVLNLRKPVIYGSFDQPIEGQALATMVAYHFLLPCSV